MNLKDNDNDAERGATFFSGSPFYRMACEIILLTATIRFPNDKCGSLVSSTIDSYFISDIDGRAIRNLVHASGTVEEAESEIKLWFKESEIMDYDLAIDKILYSMEWEASK
jgi:hypothetical protein